MTASLTERAGRRAEDAEADIRAALAESAGQQALNRALRALQSEAAKLRRRRPADAALVDSELAGSLLAIATQLHSHKPARPPGCPKVPGSRQMVAAFEASYQRAAEEEGPQ
jgi:hypothetical protein